MGSLKKYNIIYADPPWLFSNKKTGGKMKSGAQHHYKVMSISDLKELPIKRLADDNCVLVMWWVGSQPQEAIDLVKAWGFTIKNMNGFVWVKLTKKLLKFFGMGFYTRAGSESAIIAIKGKPSIESHSVRAVREAVIEAHSKKPDAFRDDIVELCGDLPRIELFARQKTNGWDSHGYEIESDISIEDYCET
jgi:N6-adenosine-specific RNA methylase IME4